MKFKSPTSDKLMVSLLSGHCLTLTPDGVNVPPHFRREVIAAGGIPVGVDTGEQDPPDENAKQRQKVILNGIDKLLDGDDAAAFNGDGKPDLRKLSAVTGFNVSRSERDEAWEIAQKGLSEKD